MPETLGFAAGALKTAQILAHCFPPLQMLQGFAQDSRRGAFAGNEQAIVHPFAFAPGSHNPRGTEVRQVAGNLGLAEAQNRDEIADANFPAGDEVEQAQAGGVRKGAEEKVERGLSALFCHAGEDNTYALTYVTRACSLHTYSPIRI